jgi:DNA-3-methyladenine glycosylase
MMEKISTALWTKLATGFYERDDVVTIARELVGKILATRFEGRLTAGRIVETEAYNGVIDRASHAYNNRRTNRTQVMYTSGGVAYVYLCYGIHQLFNVVTNVKDTPHAVLIRALEPLAGVEEMLIRTNKSKAGFDLTRGPGNVSRALGIHIRHTGMSLTGNEIFIADDGFQYPPHQVIATVRIGVDYAGEDALLPYRFIVKDNLYVSGKKTNNGILKQNSGDR